MEKNIQLFLTIMYLKPILMRINIQKPGHHLLSTNFFEDKSAIRLKYYLYIDDMKSEPHLGKYKFSHYCWCCCCSTLKDHPHICRY